MMPLGGGRAIITLRATDRDRGRHRGCGGTWVVVGCQNDVVRLAYFSQRSRQTYSDRICRSSGCDVCKCRVSLPEGVRIGEACHVSSWGNPDGANPDRNACHVSSGGGVPTMPPFNLPILPGQDGRGFCCPPTPFCGLPILLCDKTKVWVGNAGDPQSQECLRRRKLLRLAHPDRAGKVAFEDVYEEKSVDKLNVREFRERFCIPNGVSVELMDGEVVSTEKSTNNDIYFTKEQFNARLRFPLPSLFKEFLHFTQIPPAYIHPNMVRVLMGCSVLSVLFDLDLSLLEVLFIYSIKKRKNDIHSFVASLPSLQLVTSLPKLDQGGCSRTHAGQGPMGGQGKKGESEPPLGYPSVLIVRTQHTPETVAQKGGGWEHFIPKDLPFYTTMRKVDARGIIIRTPDPSFLPSVSSGSRHIACLNGSGPSVPTARRLALLAEETTSVNQPSSPHPDADVNGPATRRSRPAHDLKSGLIGQLQDRLLETIEVSCSSVQEDHPEGSEKEMAEENLTALVLVPDEGSPKEIQPAVNDGASDPRKESHPTASSGGSLVDDASCISASPFSYAELGEMLKRTPLGSNVAVPSAKMFEAAEILVSVKRNCASKSVYPLPGRASKESAEALKKSQEDNEALRIELAEEKSREESTDVHLHEGEGEMAQLRGEVRQLRTEEELETDYKKQVDKMYFFGYRCCMKKHGIKRDVPSILPIEEDKLRGKPSQ
ncbi:hypothetical protein CK203_106725 [Vitis vinifera]|uniref:Uncharacterized protein n=1 Tax=Vitis vinifera TaxID=29760 RepID=A0A438FH19_VITVI|nr:hypothetical protein CK203_106725 [Vitis vinifera]